MSRIHELASALIQHPYTRSTLVRRTMFSGALTVLWLIGAISRLSDGSSLVGGFLLLGAVFFAVRTAAHLVVLSSTPADDDTSNGSGNVEDS